MYSFGGYLMLSCNLQFISIFVAGEKLVLTIL